MREQWGAMGRNLAAGGCALLATAAPSPAGPSAGVGWGVGERAAEQGVTTQGHCLLTSSAGQRVPGRQQARA